MKRAILTLLSVLVFSNVVYGYVLEVNWIKGNSPPEYSLPEPQYTSSLVYFTVNLDYKGVYHNQWFAEDDLDGRPTLTIDPVDREIILEFQGSPSVPYSNNYDPVCGLSGYFGPLEEGEWVFVFRFPGVLLWDYFDVIPGVDANVRAEYFPNILLKGNPCLTQFEPNIDNNWGNNVVACGRSNQVSARWTANLRITKEKDMYTFTTYSDDGVLVWLNGALIINNWTDHGPMPNTSFPLELERGVYALRMEWYENAGGAVAQLFWETPTMGSQIIPPGSLQRPTPPPTEGEIRVGNSIVFEDFEYFNDNVAAGQAIFQTWIGGGDPRPGSPIGNGSGATVGHLTAPYAEQTIVYSGRQSMPLYYDNSSKGFSQADRTWDTPQNWAIQGIDSLTLQVRGQPKFAQTFAETEESHVFKGPVFKGYVLSGAGKDIWDASDEFRFAYKRLSSDGSMTARILSNGNGSNGWAKGGVMIRESLQRGSKHAMVVVTGGSGGGGAFQWRSITNGNSQSVHNPSPAVSPPYWVRIERDQYAFTAYLSPDGATWKQQGQSQNISMGQTVYIGMCVTSHASDELRTFEFDNINTRGKVYGQWQVEDIGVEQPGNDPARLYLVVRDNFEREVEVDHPDPDILLSYEWNKWEIPLRVFADNGLDLRSVKSMSIGMRDLIEEPRIEGIKLMADDSGGGGILFTDYGAITSNPAGTDIVVLQGIVMNKHTHSLIHNARVTLNPVHGGGEISGETHDGVCVLTLTKGALYNINVTANGYQPVCKPSQWFSGILVMEAFLAPVP